MESEEPARSLSGPTPPRGPSLSPGSLRPSSQLAQGTGEPGAPAGQQLRASCSANRGSLSFLRCLCSASSKPYSVLRTKDSRSNEATFLPPGAHHPAGLAPVWGTGRDWLW